MATTKMTDKGQITVPIELRRELGLSGGDMFSFERFEDGMIVRPARSVAERTAGILSKYRLPRPVSRDEEREAFELAMAEDVVARDQR